MKVFAIFFIVTLGIVVAEPNLFEKCDPLLERIEQLPLLMKRARGSVPLKIAVGQPTNKDLDLLETLFREKLGKYFRDHLETILKKIVDIRHGAEDVAEKLLEKLELKPTKEAAEEFLKELLKLEDEKDIIINLVKDAFDTNNQREVTLYSANSYGITDHINNIIEKLKQWYTGLGAWISDNLTDFKAWAKDVYTRLIDFSKPITDQIKDLAADFLKDNWHQMSKKLVKQALSFFHPYAGILGEQLVDKFIQVAKDKGLIPWERLTTVKTF